MNERARSPVIRLVIAGMVGLGLVGLAVVFIASPIGASQPFGPDFQNTGISDQTPGANADITLRTALPAGHHVLGTYSLQTDPNSWSFSKGQQVPDDYVTAVRLMEVDAGCDGSVDTYGPFNLRDRDLGGPGLEAEWFGEITDFSPQGGGLWSLTLDVDGSAQNGYIFDGFMTDVIPPPGGLCTPQIFTLTICGLANPSAAATVCGSGSDPDVATNPGSAGTYTWTGSYLSQSGGHFAEPTASICIGTSCLTPTPTSTPTQTPTGTDSDGDSLGLGDPLWLRDDIEVFIGTDPLNPCADDTIVDNEADDGGYRTSTTTRRSTSPTEAACYCSCYLEPTISGSTSTPTAR